MSLDHTFQPRGVIANTHVQSLMTSGPWRRRVVQRRAKRFLTDTQAEVWAASDGTRLLGYRNEPAQAVASPPPLVILIHGWEGSADSNYLLSAATALDEAGWATFRLNLRDHGESHHLNLGLFHSCLLFEVLDVIGQLAADWRERHPGAQVSLAGFSLGGNFTLRVARDAAQVGLKLDHAMAISPVIRPKHVMHALETGPSIYHRYFVNKWRRSLRTKQALFPRDYDFSEWLQLSRLNQQTAWLIDRYTDYPSVEDYLEGYSVARDNLSNLATPTTILTAADDPIIPIEDFETLEASDALALNVQDKGGHCGFIENWSMDSWAERWLIRGLGG
ncbi:MAG: alpha/beta fold hydrolase [Wenzhouxiangella sp.]|nr:alpha/beta fold hydrolase [Wenzhouxiangella sp.]MDR9452710.1 alpha/beta fold hydrolase [Wenzhouxiangella sp.]